MSISYFSHKTQNIMFADYRECLKAPQQLDLLEKVAVEMGSKSDVRLLVDYTGISGGMDYMARLKTLGNTVFRRHMKCSAVLGISGLKMILFNGYNRATGASNVKAFNSKNEALNWLSTF